jgi:hypothetical protein
LRWLDVELLMSLDVADYTETMPHSPLLFATLIESALLSSCAEIVMLFSERVGLEVVAGLFNELETEFFRKGDCLG